MKRIKTIVSLLLTVLLLISIVGCSGKSDDAKKDSDDKKEDTKKEEVVEEKAEEKAEEKEEKEEAEEDSSDFTKGADIVAPEGKVLRSLPVDQKAEEKIRIASICVQNNPWGAAVVVGQEFAKEVLADRNCVVDVIAVKSFDAMEWVSAIDNCTASGYDAICIFGVSDELNDSVNKAIEAGIEIYTFNGDLPDTERIAWYGMDDYAAGNVAGEAIVEALPDGGKYAIITGRFSVYGHEKRRTGCRDITDEVESLNLVGEYENDDDADTAYNLTTDLINANPDLSALYVTAGGPGGAAQAIIDAGKSGEITLICHDVLSAVADYIEDGTISVCIDQDPFNQGYQPVVDAYNSLVAGVVPQEMNAYDAVIANPDNVKSLFPELYE